jgi:hypothetical protein
MQGQLQWIQEWLGDVKLKRFMRRRHILNVDPFLTEKSYTSVREAVRNAVEGDVKSLAATTTHKVQARFKKHVLLSIFQEVCCIIALHVISTNFYIVLFALYKRRHAT